jgi:hypothetical protein
VSDDLFRLYARHEAGADGYSPEWHATIKHAVREQAGFRCIRCRHPYRNGEHGKGEWSLCDAFCTHWSELRAVSPNGLAVPVPEGFQAGPEVGQWFPWRVEAHWRILTVHHLDGNKLNCRWWNLAALCQRCHLTIQGKVRMERIWPWEHSEWFQVYVAGFYAWSYLGEDLGRAEVEARLPELLALERLA